MKDLRSKNSGNRSRTMAVSEAVGTILLLGISVILAGWVAVWSSTIEEADESVYVDLLATTSGETLSILHRGGDILDGSQTFIIIRSTSGTELLKESYHDPPARTDMDWEQGEDLAISLELMPTEFDLIVTTVRENGATVVVLRNRLVKGEQASSLPDLMVSRVRVLDINKEDTNLFREIGTYFIQVEVRNVGTNLLDVHLFAAAENTVHNLMVHDNLDDLGFSSVALTHVRGGDPLSTSDPTWGQLWTGDSMLVEFEWSIPLNDARTLGEHTLSVKVIPVFSGEVQYNNNYVERRFLVDKEVPPYIVTGPDPGIYDIYFSNDLPKRGETVVVTVVIQNSGEAPILPSHHVTLVVSTWEPVNMIVDADLGFETHDWMMDYPGHYGIWRSADSTHVLTDDDAFPTCVLTDIHLLPGAYLFLYFSMLADVEVPGGFEWVYASIDVYDSSDRPQGISVLDGDDFDDNYMEDRVQVLPRVLLVDDDASATRSKGDMTSSVLESLVGSGVNVDKTYIAQTIEDLKGTRDTPAYKYDRAEINAPAMADYDIVIWVTGYTSNGLTNVPRTGLNYGGNIQEIMDLMDDNRYFLLVGSDPLGGLSEYFDSGLVLYKHPMADPLYFSDAMEFVYDYLGIESYRSGVDLPTTSPYELVGVDADRLTPFAPPDEYTIALKSLAAGNGASTKFKLRSVQVPAMPMPGDKVFEEPEGVLTTRHDLSFGTGEYLSLRASSEPVGSYSAQYRSVVLGFDVNQTRYLNEKIAIFSSIMKWFNWEIKVGRDLAITGMEMFILDKNELGGFDRLPISEGNQPKYLDTIEIEATVRNNGLSSESSSLTFYVTGPNGLELPITPGIIDPRTPDGSPFRGRDDNPYDIGSLSGGGAELVRWKLWLAIGVGVYTFRVEVDPYHLITEVNEDNNDITYSTSTIASFITQNNILIVDDDGSSDNFNDDPATNGADKTGLLMDYSLKGGEPSETIDLLLDVHGYDHMTHTVKNRFVQATSSWDFDMSLAGLDLKRFNSIIWVTGDSGHPPNVWKETLTDNDLVMLMDYLDGNYDEASLLPSDHYENLMLVGGHIVNDLSSFASAPIAGRPTITNGQFLERYLGVIPSVSVPEEIGSGISGRQTGDLLTDLYVGMEYDMTHFDFGFSVVPLQLRPEDPTVESVAPALYTRSVSGTPLIAAYYTRHDPTPTLENYFRTVLHSWQFTAADHDDHESLLHELVYLPLHSFGTPDSRADLVSRSVFIEFEEDHPSIQNNYLINIEVANLGGASGGGTVRFMDGGTLIKSQFIFLDPDSKMTVEATWTPLFAGVREIWVMIDVQSDTDEVLDVLNNRPMRTIEVFFFWDDLESGPGNWRHDAVMALINGESPIDYLDAYDTNPSTNIMKDWDKTMSVGLAKVNNVSHSAPSSFWLQEAVGTPKKANVILGLVIDNSPSMFNRVEATSGKTWLQIAVESSVVLVDSLTDDSLVCIWIFSGANARQQLPLTSLSGTGRSTVLTSLNGIRDGQMTQIWDGIGSAYLEVKSAVPTYPGHYPVVVALSDGADYKSSDVSSPQPLKLEAASETWAPWHDMQPELGYPTVTYAEHKGKYTIPYTGLPRWYTAGAGSFKGTRRGLLTSDVQIFTIGLGLEHHDPPDQPVWGGPWVEGWQENSYATYGGAGALESGTTEYNLWRISTTSGAKYFHTPTPDQLKDIFNAISVLIAEEAGQTRADGDPVENSDKSAVTPELDLTYASSAYVTFWHRYNMVSGTNGAFIQIGYKDPDVLTSGDMVNDWDWRYSIPMAGQYSGNLYLASDRYDSFGNEITWGWTGISGKGSFGWEHTKLDLLKYVPNEYRGAVRVKFNYTQYGGGTGDGWWIDDVRIIVSRAETSPVSKDFPDLWSFATGSVIEGTTHSGEKAWFAGGPGRTDLNDGVDNSLYTRPIDLTNAKFSAIEMYFRFNIEVAAGRPPDSLRIEVSRDNGLSWMTLNYGARAFWGVSGTELDDGDGIMDGRSFTGIEEGPADQGWVPSGSITRLAADLNTYNGNVIMLRFRIVTNADGVHCADPDEFKGIYLDDIVIYGTSTESTRGSEGFTLTPPAAREMPRTENGDRTLTGYGPEAPLAEAGIEETTLSSSCIGPSPGRATIPGPWTALLPLLALLVPASIATRRRTGRP